MFLILCKFKILLSLVLLPSVSGPDWVSKINDQVLVLVVDPH